MARPPGSRRGTRASVVDALRQDDEIVQNEVFGPVISVTRFSDTDEAVAWATGREQFGQRIYDYQGISFPLAASHTIAVSAPMKTRMPSAFSVESSRSSGSRSCHATSPRRRAR